MIGRVEELGFSEHGEDSVNVRIVSGIVDDTDVGTDEDDRD